MMPKISTGDSSTLGTYRDIAFALTQDENSRAVKYFDDKIKTSSKGRDTEVIAAETQVIYLIGQLMFGQPDEEVK